MDTALVPPKRVIFRADSRHTMCNDANANRFQKCNYPHIVSIHLTWEYGRVHDEREKSGTLAVAVIKMNSREENTQCIRNGFTKGVFHWHDQRHAKQILNVWRSLCRLDYFGIKSSNQDQIVEWKYRQEKETKKELKWESHANCTLFRLFFFLLLLLLIVHSLYFDVCAI